MPRPPRNRKANVAYVLFWKINEKNGIFSQWYPSPIKILSPMDGSTMHEFCNAEQYMMWQKAVLFKDMETAGKILATNIPAEIKKLGRTVTGFDDLIWNASKYDIVKQANFRKFTQNKVLYNRMIGIKNKARAGATVLFAEASPLDNVWGIGFAPDAALKNIDKWGENLLGKALTEVYEEICENAESQSDGWVVLD